MCGAKERPDQFLTRDRVPKSARSLCRAFIITESVFFVYFGADKAWGFLPYIFKASLTAKQKGGASTRLLLFHFASNQ